jgi:hypothetical protein
MHALTFALQSAARAGKPSAIVNAIVVANLPDLHISFLRKLLEGRCALGLKKAGPQIEAIACEHHRNEQPDAGEHTNRFKIVDIGRNVFRSTVLSIVPDFSKVHHLGSTAFVLHLPSSQYLSNPLMM